MNGVRGLVPAWVRGYRRGDLRGDLISGVTVAVMLVPQGMAYAVLAGLPPVVGLYASTIPLLAYALRGSSRQLSVGPVAIDSLLVLSGVSAVASAGSGGFVALAALLALMVGVVQLALGLLRAGFVVNFVSGAVVSGFTSAAAIVIALSQLEGLLGVDVSSAQSTPGLLLDIGRKLAETDPLTLAVGLGGVAVLLAGKRLAPRFPAPLVAVALGTLLTYSFGLHERGVAVVGEVPKGLPGFALPAIDGGALFALLPTALTIAFIGYVEAFAVAKSIAAREGYAIDADREFEGLGLANVGASLFSGYPVTGGFSRSAVNHQAGARTQLSGVVTAALVLLALWAFTPLFYYLPGAVLSAIVLVAVYGLIDPKAPARLFRLKPIDGWTLVATFAATLLVGVQWGVPVGVAFSLLVFVYRAAYPHTARLGYLPQKGVFRNLDRFPEAETFPNTTILRVDASLYFANMAFLGSLLRDAASKDPELRHVVLDFSGVNSIDAVAAQTMEELMEELKLRGISVHIAAMKGPVRDVAAKAGWRERFGPRLDHLSLEGALQVLGLWEPGDGHSRAGAGRADGNEGGNGQKDDDKDDANGDDCASARSWV